MGELVLGLLLERLGREAFVGGLCDALQGEEPGLLCLQAGRVVLDEDADLAWVRGAYPSR